MSDHTPNWESLRQYYPLLEKGVYLKSASIAAMHKDVLDEITKWNLFMAQSAGSHEEKYFELLMDVHHSIATFLGCDQEDVTLLENTSHNMNILAMMLADEKRLGKNEIVAVSDEFPSNILPFYHHGFKVNQVKTDGGEFSAEDLFERVNNKTAAVVCSVVQFSSGQYTDPLLLSKLAKEKGVHLFLNTTQALGTLPFSLKDLQVSALTSSCHKWLGAGIGASLFYMSKEFRRKRPYPLAGWCSVAEPFEMKNEKPQPREDVMALQLGSLPFAVLAGVAKACEVISSIGLAPIQKRLQGHTHTLRTLLKEKGLKPLGNGQSGITTFALYEDPVQTQEFVDDLKKKNIHVNCRRGLIRVSPHFYNTEEEIKTFMESLILKA